MKKALLLGVSCLSALCSTAQNATEPLILPEFYAFKISSDGKWLYSDTGSGEIIIYDLATNQHNEFYGMSLGNGNALALDGTAVGSTDMGKAVILKGDEEISPAVFDEYWNSLPFAITDDSSRMVGIVGNNGTSNLDDKVQYFLPFVADIDDEGNVSNLTFLPHPDKDFFGVVPQYCSASWISNDGKVILGQVIDGSGMLIQPIVYRQGEDGEWTYSLPSKSLFNPENLPLPEYPGEFTMTQPNPIDFIGNEEKKKEYQEDMDWWKSQGNFEEELYPGNHLEEYMTYEEIEEYNKAVEEFNKAVKEYNEKIEEYYEARDAILDTSVSFELNGSCLNSDGTLAAMASEYVLDDGEIELGFRSGYTTYIIDLSDDSMIEIKNENPYIHPTQVLNGNIIIGATVGAEAQATYVYLPGASDYIPVEDYFAATTPYAADWLQENLVQPLYDGSMAMISGRGVASDDFSVFASGVPAYMFDENYVYLTYIFNGLTTGIKEVTAYENSALRVLAGGVIAINGEVADLAVFDLSGRNLFAMQNASGNISTDLAPGLYVISYTDSLGQRLSQKVRF